MQTNIAIAYNNVVVTDPQSIMKAGKIILNIETKVINIGGSGKQAHSLAGRFCKKYLGYKHSETGYRRIFLIL